MLTFFSFLRNFFFFCLFLSLVVVITFLTLFKVGFYLRFGAFVSMIMVFGFFFYSIFLSSSSFLHAVFPDIFLIIFGFFFGFARISIIFYSVFSFYGGKGMYSVVVLEFVVRIILFSVIFFYYKVLCYFSIYLFSLFSIIISFFQTVFDVSCNHVVNITRMIFRLPLLSL